MTASLIGKGAKQCRKTLSFDYVGKIPHLIYQQVDCLAWFPCLYLSSSTAAALTWVINELTLWLDERQRPFHGARGKGGGEGCSSVQLISIYMVSIPLVMTIHKSSIPLVVNIVCSTLYIVHILFINPSSKIFLIVFLQYRKDGTFLACLVAEQNGRSYLLCISILCCLL